MESIKQWWQRLLPNNRQLIEADLAEYKQRLERTELLGQPIMWEWDSTEGLLVSCSDDFAALFEMPTEQALELFDRHTKDLLAVHPDDREDYLSQQAKGPNSAGNIVTEYRILTGVGAIRHVRETTRVELDEDGTEVYEYGSMENITAEKVAAQSLLDTEERYRRLYDENPSMFFTLNALGMVLNVNSYGANQLGHTPDDLIGKPFASLVYEPDVALALSSVQKTLAQPDLAHHWELRLVRKDGSRCWVRETGRAITEQGGELQVLLVCEDITETHRLAEQLSYHASHDALTQLLNRREFDQRLKRILETAKEENSEHALCYMDLDQFKLINDSYGHSAGDELLRQLGELLKNSVRKRDTLARLGGDEFGVLMEHCNLQQAERVAEGLRKQVENFRFGWEDRIFKIGVSIGLVPITNTGLNSVDVLKQADAACYAAKDAGRNRVHVYLEADTEIAHRHGEMQLIERLNSALTNNQLELYSQTITPVNGSASNGVHYEVLLRMNDDKGNPVSPSTFLAAAERYGVAPRLDRWVMEHVFAHLQDNPAFAERVTQCAINLSGLSLSNSDFHDVLLALLRNSNIAPDKICFEITETAAISNLTAATKFMHSLRDQGCKFALDDFGSGLSSFAYLKSLPVDYLKIDGFFVRDIATDQISYAMVKSIHDIGRLMGMQTIAESVENDAILEKLKDIGVDFAQGFGISRPRPIRHMYN